MRKTTIAIDDDLVAQAREALGTKGLQETINAALAEVVRAHLRRLHAERLREMRGLDLDRPEVMSSGWH